MLKPMTFGKYCFPFAVEIYSFQIFLHTAWNADNKHTQNVEQAAGKEWLQTN